MYRRADLSRTMMLVVALFLTAAATSAFAREFRAADTQNEDHLTVQAQSVQARTVQALHDIGSFVAERCGGHLQLRIFHSRQLGEATETIEQTRAGGVEIVTDFDRRPSEATMADIYAKAERDPAVVRLSETIRKVQ